MKTILSALILGIMPAISLYAEPSKTKKAQTMKITSSAFQANAAIPAKFTCDGADISPPLAWQGVPNGTKTLALICDDPDAPVGTWVHWVLYGLPATTTELAEKVVISEKLSSGAKQGTNDFRKIGYGGPCPPPGKPHHYYFKLYALDTELVIKAGATKQELVQVMKGHIIGEGQLVGTYQRKK